jgi:hypothetical protein
MLAALDVLFQLASEHVVLWSASKICRISMTNAGYYRVLEAARTSRAGANNGRNHLARSTSTIRVNLAPPAGQLDLFV